MNADGSDQHSITQGPNDATPIWSPDGERIAYVGGTRRAPAIMVMNADGSSPQTVLRDKTFIAGFSWSPDGRKIVFASGRDHPAGEIYVMNADGSAVKRLTKNKFGDNAPLWSR
jgi:TolB protein